MQHAVHHEVLQNGISLIVVPLPSTAAVTSLVFMGVGSRNESEVQRGLAHFTEHMVFKGGKTFTSAKAVAQALDAVGGEFNAFTSHEFTGFYTKTAAEHATLGLDVLSDMVLHATFPETELEKEKGVIVEEINMYEDMPMRKVDHVLMDLVYGDTPLGRPILGTKKSVTGFTRDDFMKYREEFYKGGACTIAIAGSITPEDAKKLVLERFSELPAGERVSPLPAVFLEGPRIKVEEKKSEQSHLMLAVKAYSTSDPKYHALRMLATLLGGNMSSRLFTKVREEQGLCYYVRASTDTYHDTGMLIASAGVDNARLPQAIAAIIAELKNLRDHGVPADELERTKQFLVGKAHLSMEDSEDIAEYYGIQDLLEGKRETIEESVEKLKAVTAEEVDAVARELFVDEWIRLAVIGPHQDSAALEKLLTFD
jgi:predicted Zn-dependent peptidase